MKFNAGLTDNNQYQSMIQEDFQNGMHPQAASCKLVWHQSQIYLKFERLEESVHHGVHHSKNARLQGDNMSSPVASPIRPFSTIVRARRLTSSTIVVGVPTIYTISHIHVELHSAHISVSAFPPEPTDLTVGSDTWTYC